MKNKKGHLLGSPTKLKNVKNEKGHLHGSPTRLKNVKTENGEDDGGWPYKENLNFRGHITLITHIYAILPLIITKLPLWAHNGGLVTWAGSLTWRKRGNDVGTLSSS